MEAGPSRPGSASAGPSSHAPSRGEPSGSPAQRPRLSEQAAAQGSRGRSRTSSSGHSTVSDYGGPEGEQWAIGSSYDYAAPEQISDWVKCAICLGPFVEPWAAPSCSHTFCRLCIEQHHRAVARGGLSQDEPTPCPSCRCMTKLSHYKGTPPLIKNLVDSLAVQCPMKQRGCSWIGERSLLDHHLRINCGWTWVGEFDDAEEVSDDQVLTRPCSVNNSPPSPELAHRRRRRRPCCECGARVFRKDWDEHRSNGCSAKWERCQWCSEMIRVVDVDGVPLNEDHVDQCPAFPTECEHCHETVTRSQLPQHVGEECLEITVSCSMAIYGCIWRGARGSLNGTSSDVMGRSAEGRDEAPHAAQCPFLRLRPFIEASNARLQTLEDENASLKALVDEHRGALRDNQAMLYQCIAALGRWARHSDEAGGPHPPGARPSISGHGAAPAPGMGDGDIEWPLDVEATDDASLSAVETEPESASAPSARPTSYTRAETPASSSARPRSAGPSQLESTIDELVTATSHLNKQNQDISHLLHESRRESLMASMDVGRLAEDLASFRMGLHNVARHLHMRPQAFRPGSSAAVGANNASSTSGAAGEGASGSAGEEGSGPGGPMDIGYLAGPTFLLGGLGGSGDLRAPGISPTSSMGIPIHGHAHPHPYPSPYSYPHGHGPYPPLHPPPPHHAQYGPMPGMRRLWSGFEQNKL